MGKHLCGITALLGAPPTNYHRFCRAQAERGPHAIPRKRQISNEFHRIFSVKAGMRVVIAESPLEADAIVRAEADPEVVHICEQALRIYESVGSRPYVTLDLGLTYRNGREVFYEIKPERRLRTTVDGRRVPPHWEEIEGWCHHNGHQCGVITDVDLAPHQQLIANWRHLIPYVRQAREQPDPALEADLLKLLEESRPLSLAELSQQRPAIVSQTITAAIANLLHQGVLTGDLDEAPISPQTTVRSIRSA